MDHLNKPTHHNRALLCGSVSQPPQPSHTNHGQQFFRFLLSVPRLSGQCDLIPVMVPQQLLESCPLREGDNVTVSGQLRSFNNRSGSGPRLVISLLARSITLCEGAPCNVVHLCGTICKTPTFRRTPMGRQICDVILAVNRRYGRADYLPCISWGVIAERTALMDVGESLCLEGRIQSRTYNKALGDQRCEERTAYEVSVMRPAAPEEFFADTF